MPVITLAGNALGYAGRAAAAFGDQVSPAVQGLAQTQLGVEQLKVQRERARAEQADDMARRLLGEQELEISRQQLQLDEERIGFSRDQAQAKAALAEMEERQSLMKQRATLSEEARRVGYSVTPEGTAGLVMNLLREDPQGFAQVAAMFPEGIQSDAEVPIVWRAAADTLLEGRKQRAQANKIGSAQRIATQFQVDRGGFWQEEQVLGLQALASDPNTTPEEYAAAEAELVAENKKRQRLAADVKVYGAKMQQALGDPDTLARLTPEDRDWAYDMLGDLHAGKIEDPATAWARFDIRVSGHEGHVERVKEDAFRRGIEVGAMARMQQQSAMGAAPSRAALAQPGDSAAPAPATRPMTDAEVAANNDPTVEPGSPVYKAIQPEVQTQADSIRQEMQAAGLDWKNADAVREFIKRRSPKSGGPPQTSVFNPAYQGRAGIY